MKDGKLIIGCYGWREASTEELIESCRDCEIHVYKQVIRVINKMYSEGGIEIAK